VHAAKDDRRARQAEGVLAYVRAWLRWTVDRAELDHYASKLDITRRATDRLSVKTYLDDEGCAGCTPGLEAEARFAGGNSGALERTVVVYGEW
jgi:hypothetical protein